MWIDERGVQHTVALPDPTTVMSERFRHGLDLLVERHADDVAELVEAEEQRVYAEFAEPTPGNPADEADFVEVPAGLTLVDDVATLDDLRAAIRGVASRWRLDVLLALDDYVTD